MRFIKPLYKTIHHFVFSLPFMQRQASSHISGGNLSLNKEKQLQLRLLCEELLKRKDLIVSGKIQFLGLEKIKKKMGKRWHGLCEIIYSTADEVIQKHLSKGDIFIRHKDDTYVMIFAHSSLEEGQVKGALIAEEIRQRLFQMEEDELRELEIRRAIGRIRTTMLANLDFPSLMDSVATLSEKSTDKEAVDKPEQDAAAIAKPQSTQVEAGYYKKASSFQDSTEVPALSYYYQPLWDTQKGALTTYLCLARTSGNNTSPFLHHVSIFKDYSIDTKVQIDLAILDEVAAELQRMEDDDRRFYIICPVQYESLHKYDHYEIYKERLAKIPLAHRRVLIVLIMNPIKELLFKDAYWFAAPLRQLCGHVFAEVPLQKSVNFSYLQNTGVDVVGLQLEQEAEKKIAEHDLINAINVFANKAKAMKMAKTFVLGASTLSATTTAVCAGFHYISGPAIHDTVQKPDIIRHFKHENLLAGLLSKIRTT